MRPLPVAALYYLVFDVAAFSFSRSEVTPVRSLRSAFADPSVVGAAHTKPDECRPRDEEAANKNGRSCKRKCDNDSNCLNERRLCLCDGECGLSCIRPEKECPELPDPPNGQVHLTGRHFNDRAVYTCEDGYQIVGSEQVLCNSDGLWSGTMPSCKKGSSSAQSRYYCGEPTHIANAKHNGTKDQLFYDLDSEVTYTCLSGYRKEGFQEAQCFFYNDSARWFGPDLKCHPIDCGKPQDLLNGKKRGECTTFKCQISYECLPGFDLVGETSLYCQSDGTWTSSELPICMPVQCPIPEDPVNGKAMFTAVAYKSVVSYECKYGFMIVGDATRTCGEDKLWTGREPLCKEINCGSPGFLPNGWLEGSRTTLHSDITFKCIDGMKFQGESYRTTCKANGKWSHPLPHCLAPCIIPSISMGKAVNLSIGATVMHGDSINVTCDDNYELAMTNISVRAGVQCNNGTWTRIPQCEPARCKSMPATAVDGIVLVPHMRHGSVGLHRCKDGFILKGENRTRCHFGNWTGATPRCQIVYCSFPGYVEGGKVLLVGNMGLYDYRPYVRQVTNNRQIVFTCARGFRLTDGPPGATCIDGRWSPPELPRCVDEFHPRMVQWKRKRRSVHSIRSSIREKGLLQRRAKREMVTRRKHMKSTAKDRHCNAFSDTNMHIEVVRSSGQQSGNDTSLVKFYSKGTVLKLTCSDGFKLDIAKRKVRCSGRGVWRPSATGTASTGTAKSHPTCVPLLCRVLRLLGGMFAAPVRVGGVILPAGGEVEDGGQVEAHCDSGHFLSGPSRLLCRKGEWIPSSLNNSGEAELTAAALPTECVGNPCKLPDIGNGGRYLGRDGNLRPGQHVPHGEVIDFECADAKNVPGPLECQRGHLAPKNPECLVANKVGKRTSSSSELWPGAFEYSASHFLVPNGDLSSAGTSNAARNDFGSTSTRLIQPRLGCPQPRKVDGSVVYLAESRQPLTLPAENQITFPHGSEITFNCLPPTLLDRDYSNEDYPFYDGEDYEAETETTVAPHAFLQSWKIVCENGEWNGRSEVCNGQRDDEAAFNASCIFKPTVGSIVAFHGDRMLEDGEEHFQAGEELVFRCSDIGKYRFEGSMRRRCIGGVWDGKGPKCEGLNQLHDYDLERPPTILFRHENGHIAQSNSGKLVLTPGTILHMECLFVRKHGRPAWYIRNYSARTYPQEWTTAPGRDAQLEYRLSIYHAKENDTGSYTCETPFGKHHTIGIIVKEVKCPPIVTSPGLVASSSSARLNSLIHFSCDNGHRLLGHSPLRCLPSGRWSHPTPACLDVVCSQSIVRNSPPALIVTADAGFGVGALVRFSCATGYVLEGPAAAECRADGRWSVEKPPRCRPIKCTPPKPPEHGMIGDKNKKSFHVGETIRFFCLPGFMLVGRPLSECGTSGAWRWPPPVCVRACTYPGSVVGGRITVLKFYYPVGASVSFECHRGRRVQGTKRIECRPNGQWSAAVPLCVVE